MNNFQGYIRKFLRILTFSLAVIFIFGLWGFSKLFSKDNYFDTDVGLIKKAEADVPAGYGSGQKEGDMGPGQDPGSTPSDINGYDGGFSGFGGPGGFGMGGPGSADTSTGVGNTGGFGGGGGAGGGAGGGGAGGK